MRALIFGCGYLGRRVARRWIEEGNDVIAVTRNQENANVLHQMGLQPLIGDVCEFSSLRILPEVDVVLHSIGFDRASGKSQQEVTCGGMQNVLKAIQGRCRRFIQISSTSVYGQSTGEWVNEDSECRPTQLGGQLTLVAENLVRDAFSAKSDCTGNILRLAGIYGPGRLLSRVESLQAGLTLTGRGDSWLNLIHVDDAASAVLDCAKRAAPNATYNVVDDRPIERREYFDLLAKLIDAPAPTFDSTQPSARGSGGLNKRCSNQKLRQELGWVPVYSSIETGLPASINA